MSALVGLLAKDWPQTERKRALAAMAHSLKGRGTEPFANWTLESEPVGLGIRELITKDLTPDGRQPALSSLKPIAVILDGIIGNASALRRDLEDAGIKPRGYSDAELLAELVAQYGLNRTLQRLEGAFAFALWDGETQSLHLVRDRMGAKPLFVTKQGNIVAFASSPDAFEGLGGYQKRFNPNAVASFLSLGYSQGTDTLLKDVISLPPGHRLMLKADSNSWPAPECWWNPATTLEEIALRGTSGTRQDRMLEILTTEASQTDVPFHTLDDGSIEARNQDIFLSKKSDKAIRGVSLTTPDAVSVQGAFEKLSELAMPTADADACLLSYTFKTRPDLSGHVVLTSCPSAGILGESNDNTAVYIPRPIKRMAARLMPKQFSHLAIDAQTLVLENYGYWQGHENPATPHFEASFERPRLSLSERDCALFYGLAGPLREARLPAQDAVAGLYNIDLRCPWADHRILEYQIPTLHRSKADIGGWMRGPLRIRMQNTLNNMCFEMLQIKRSDVIMSNWQKFLAGENSKTHALWAWLCLATWASSNRLT